MVRQVRLLAQSNPDIGVRGCRLGILYPELVEMQTRAILGAAMQASKNGDASFMVQIMIPMVSTDHEIEDIAPVIKASAEELFKAKGEHVNFTIGSSLDVPRACMRANAIVSEGDVAFLSINTNMLTELVYGMSRADSSRLVESYQRIGIMKKDPFVSLDQSGVGSLLKIAKNLIRKTNRFIRVGVCGEQSGDPASIEFYDALGMDYVSECERHFSIVCVRLTVITPLRFRATTSWSLQRRWPLHRLTSQLPQVSHISYHLCVMDMVLTFLVGLHYCILFSQESSYGIKRFTRDNIFRISLITMEDIIIKLGSQRCRSN